jgi:uncharacterized membrane protein (UPF0127 family)
MWALLALTQPLEHAIRIDTMPVRSETRLIVILAAAAAIWWSVDLASGDSLSTAPQFLPISAKAEMGTETILLEVAQTPKERALGLRFRPTLPDDRGMLFSNKPARPARMWMKNVPVPLDMVFVHEGRIVGLAEQVPPCAESPCPTYGPFRQAVDHVIELRAGRIADLGLRPGDQIRITHVVP